jgi:hypothetical protein
MRDSLRRQQQLQPSQEEDETAAGMTSCSDVNELMIMNEKRL